MADAAADRQHGVDQHQMEHEETREEHKTINDLPDEVLSIILDHGSVKRDAQLRAVSRKWRDVIDQRVSRYDEVEYHGKYGEGFNHHIFSFKVGSRFKHKDLILLKSARSDRKAINDPKAFQKVCALIPWRFVTELKIKGGTPSVNNPLFGLDMADLGCSYDDSDDENSWGHKAISELFRPEIDLSPWLSKCRSLKVIKLDELSRGALSQDAVTAMTRNKLDEIAISSYTGEDEVSTFRYQSFFSKLPGANSIKIVLREYEYGAEYTFLKLLEYQRESVRALEVNLFSGEPQDDDVNGEGEEPTKRLTAPKLQSLRATHALYWDDRDTHPRADFKLVAPVENLYLSRKAATWLRDSLPLLASSLKVLELDSLVDFDPFHSADFLTKLTSLKALKITLDLNVFFIECADMHICVPRSYHASLEKLISMMATHPTIPIEEIEIDSAMRMHAEPVIKLVTSRLDGSSASDDSRHSKRINLGVPPLRRIKICHCDFMEEQVAWLKENVAECEIEVDDYLGIDY